MGAPTEPCEVCNYPTYIPSDGILRHPHICSNCHMIANDLRHFDGSGPQDRMTPEEINAIKEKHEGITA